MLCGGRLRRVVSSGAWTPESERLGGANWSRMRSWRGTGEKNLGEKRGARLLIPNVTVPDCDSTIPDRIAKTREEWKNWRTKQRKNPRKKTEIGSRFCYSIICSVIYCSFTLASRQWPMGQISNGTVYNSRATHSWWEAAACWWALTDSFFDISFFFFLRSFFDMSRLCFL